MVALAPPPYVLADTLCCLGLGFFLAVCYDMSRFVFGGSRPVCFVLDVAAAFAAGVSIFGLFLTTASNTLLAPLLTAPHQPVIVSDISDTSTNAPNRLIILASPY